MKRGGIFTARLDTRRGTVRVPHGLGTIPTYWDMRPLGRFRFQMIEADGADLIAYLGSCGPLRSWFPIEWWAELDNMSQHDVR